MILKEGAKVLAAEGEQVGQLDRVVVYPQRKEVSHIVVRKGLLFTEDKVVPVSLIDASTDDQVALREDAGNLEALPDFEEDHYLGVGETDSDGEQDQVPSLYWFPPVATTGWWYGPFPIAPRPPYTVETVQNIPAGTIALKVGAAVIASDGERVGDVEKILTDLQENRATHIVISEGLIRKERKLVPTTWVTQVDEEELHLTFGSGFIDALDEYPAS
jgi:uncharacterized protein YrrD